MDEPRSVAELLRAPQTPGFHFFWGHTARGAAPGPWCLSQWWPAPFTIDGREFATAEHHMMWSKATLFGDDRVAAAVLETDSPKRAKALGREVAGFDGPRWAQHRYDTVVVANLAKFGQHPELRRYLLGTGDAVIVEASPDDVIWGIGLAATDPDAVRPERWPGTNLLGFALMEVRAALRP